MRGFFAPAFCALTDHLGTARLDLRRVTDRDDDILAVLTSDPAIARAEGVRHHAARVLLSRSLSDWARYGHGKYLVSLKSSRACVGFVGFSAPFWGRTPDLGWSVLTPYRRQGYAVEAAAAVLAAAHQAGLPRLTSAIQAGNTASLGVARRLGLVDTGWRRLWPDRARLFAFCPAKC